MGYGDEAGRGETTATYEPAFVVVFRGSHAAAMTCALVLESAGLSSRIEDQYGKTIYPFITGGNVFEVELQVPATEFQEASRALEEARSAGGAGEGDGEDGVEGAVEPADEAAPATEQDVDPERGAREADGTEEVGRTRRPSGAELEANGRQLRWFAATLFTVGAALIAFRPLAVALGGLGVYLLGDFVARVRRAHGRPLSFFMTVSASLCATSMLFFFAVMAAPIAWDTGLVWLLRWFAGYGPYGPSGPLPPPGE